MPREEGSGDASSHAQSQKPKWSDDFVMRLSIGPCAPSLLSNCNADSEEIDRLPHRIASCRHGGIESPAAAERMRTKTSPWCELFFPHSFGASLERSLVGCRVAAAGVESWVERRDTLKGGRPRGPWRRQSQSIRVWLQSRGIGLLISITTTLPLRQSLSCMFMVGAWFEMR